MATVIDLSFLGDRGFVIRGGAANDLAGYSVASAGDINGDGYADMIIGAPEAEQNGDLTGKAYVIFGKKDGFGPIDLGRLSPADGFSIIGESPIGKGSLTGASVSSAGDFNGDGYDDFIVGAPGDDRADGAAYLIYGKAGGFADVSLDALAREDGFKIGSEDFERAGTSVSSAGDVNGDGFADIVVGAPRNPVGEIDDGHAYVIFGSAGGYESIDLGDLPAAKGITILGDAENDQAGFSVSGAGDVNGDGFSDIIVGAKFADGGGTSSGEAYVIFGKASGFGQNGTIDLANLAAADGFTIQGDSAGDKAGFSVASAGDFNADGYADLIVGASESDDGGINAGAAYVIFGKASGLGPIDLTNLAHKAGFVILGDETYDNAGRSVSSAGDVNGDGFDDIIIGASRGNDGGSNAGQAYVIYGKSHGFDRVIDVSALGDKDGFVIQGDTGGDQAGFSVSAAGDVNGDGFADVIVGAPYGDDLGTDAGNAYVIYGAGPTEDVRLKGTEIANTIQGGLGDDVIRGRGGDDTLTGGAGDDAIEGQGGNDSLQGDDGDDKLVGGAGDDFMGGAMGDDRLSGGRGADVLWGGYGQDTLTGGEGADQFHFSEGGTAPDAANADRIVDFSRAGGDVIDLSDYDARPGTPTIDPFTFIGTSSFSGVIGQLRYQFSGGDTLVSGDTNGDRRADFTIRLDGQIALASTDFVFAAPAAPAGGLHAFMAQVDLHADYRMYLA